jgi:hypothetical protein
MYETVDSLLAKLQKIKDAGNGDAFIYFMDTRSGISERCRGSSRIELNVDLETGENLEKAYPIFED